MQSFKTLFDNSGGESKKNENELMKNAEEYLGDVSQTVINENHKESLNEGGGLDQIAADELKLYMDNDSDLYKQKDSYLKNMVIKVAQGKYDHKLAPKLWMFYVERGAKKYYQEFGGGGSWNDMFNKATRLAVAKEYADEEFDEIKSGEYTKYVPKKYSKSYAYGSDK